MGELLASQSRLEKLSRKSLSESGMVNESIKSDVGKNQSTTTLSEETGIETPRSVLSPSFSLPARESGRIAVFSPRNHRI